MSKEDEESHIEANVKVIQGYLLSQFKGFEECEAMEMAKLSGAL